MERDDVGKALDPLLCGREWPRSTDRRPDGAHVLVHQVHEGEWDHARGWHDQREGSREAGSNVEYFAMTK
jgi:hypothetical protein